ncbi:MAG: metal ABC transporter permease [Staphylothermus sp.]|nr:metal ABC transporter permease [Staphylothermus sp.]
MKHLRLLLLVLLLICYTVILSIKYNLAWIMVMLSAAVAFGSLSSLVSMRKLYFLAGATPHAALFAITLSIPLTKLLGVGNSSMYSILLGILLVYIVGFSIYKGINSDIATAVFVGITASGSVITAYYVLTYFPVEYDLTALIMGDPLLSSMEQAFISAVLASIVLITVLLTYREQLSLGIDRESAILSGLRIELYDAIVFTVLGLVTISMLRIVGYILEHILVLLPSSIAVMSAKSAREALYISIISALTSSLLGLHIGMILNISPSGLTGLILLLFYIISLVGKRK